MRRTHCGGCGDEAEWIEEFLDLGETPLANDLPKTRDQEQRKYPLQLGVCTECWLVQMMHTPPADEVFGGDYTFYSGTSPALVRYHERYAERLIETHLGDESDLVIEVACNDGDLLRRFRNAGYRAVGIDPALGPVTYARDEHGLDVTHAALTRESGANLRDEYGPARLVVANHVTAHVIDLRDFLDGVYELLADDGCAVLEVQYLPDLLVGNQFDHVYHEHRYFFSLSALGRAAEHARLEVVDVRLVAQQGGSLQVTLARGSDANLPSANVAELLARELPVRHISAYSGTQMRAERVRDRLLELLEIERAEGRRVAGYGMPAKATTLLNFCGIDTRLVHHIIDTTPAKIGRYVPGAKIPVIGPDDDTEPDTYLVLVWNYLRSIMRREREFTDYGGRLIVPIPVPVVM